MAATQPGSARPTLTRCASADSVLSTITVEASSNVQLSSSSTPPSSAADSASVSFTSIKLDIANSTETNAGVELERVPASNSRTWRSRASIFGTYNIKVLSGTAVHAPKKYRNDEEREIGVLTRRRTISGGTSLGSVVNADISSQIVVSKAKMSVHGIETLNSQWTTDGMSRTPGQIAHGIVENLQKGKRLGEGKDTDRRRSSRLSGEKAESFTKRLSVLGKRGRHAFEASLAKAKRELKNLADTNEFAKIDTKPVVSEVWSNGKLVTDHQSPKTRATTGKTTTVPEAKKVEQSVVTTIPTKGREKLWLNKGLYAGQDTRDLDWFRGKASLGNIKYPEYNPNGILPLPMWHGQRILYAGRDFKLPFDVCSPLPPGQPKPDEWRKVPKNRFVGDAAAAWKKSTVFDDFSSRCVCSPHNGCDDSCQNRIMLYECDDGNCSAGREHCTNRSFADLQERRSKGGKYRIGVEVIKTTDRGYGVRTNRSFDPHQIIVEYTGEIITEEECDRRMNEDYKDNECYYLMLFDQNMIIDATRGSIARFVNHSCEPNCRMVKWIVAGKPRMALFAGDRPIMTGEELTYDYNFDPFSAKNVQKCRCGSQNCRGILGPRLKDQKLRGTIGDTVGQTVSPSKRKLKDFLVGDNDTKKSKKRKAGEAAQRPTLRKAIYTSKGLRSSLQMKVSSSIIVKKKFLTKSQITNMV